MGFKRPVTPWLRVGVGLLLTPLAFAQELNRLELHNETDVLWLINTPFVGAPVSNFDPTGDLYWKCFPADTLVRADGDSNLMGIEAVNFDTDFFSSETLWAYTITAGTTGTDQNINPTFSGAGVFVPGTSTTGTIFGSAGCAKPGYLSGWVYTETFVDTATSLPAPLLDLTADGSIDWVFTHYFPAPGIADHDLSGGPINSCGSTGDATLQWGASTDGFGAGNTGENAADWTGLGISGYSGFNIGGAGTFFPIPDAVNDGVELDWYFDEAVVTARVDTNNGDGFPGPEVGTAAHRTPLQINDSASPNGVTIFIGARIYDRNAATDGTAISFFSANLGPTLIDLGIGCLPFGGANLCLNPADPAFQPVLLAMGFNPYQDVPDGAPGVFSDSNQIPIGSGMEFELSWQGFCYDLLVGSVISSSQIFKQHFHF